MANKSKSAFRTIAEVANEIGVATHVLRFWETKFKEISPMKATGGRRYYRPDDVALIKLIRDFLYEKRYTIEGVQKIFKEYGAKAFLSGEIQKDFFENDAIVTSSEIHPAPVATQGISEAEVQTLCQIRDDLFTLKGDLTQFLKNN